MPKRALQQRPGMEVPMPGITAWQRLIFTSIIKYLHLDVYDSSEYYKIKLYKRAAIWNIFDSVCVVHAHTYALLYKCIIIDTYTASGRQGWQYRFEIHRKQCTHIIMPRAHLQTTQHGAGRQHVPHGLIQWWEAALEEGKGKSWITLP